MDRKQITRLQNLAIAFALLFTSVALGYLLGQPDHGLAVFIYSLTLIYWTFLVLAQVVNALVFWREEQDFRLLLVPGLAALAIIYLWLGPQKVALLLFVLSLYLLLLAANYLVDVFVDVIPNAQALVKKRHYRVSEPVILTALMPYMAMQSVNQALKSKKPQTLFNLASSQEVKGRQADLELFVHVYERKFGVLGHVDFAYEGQVYSYGCYDLANNLIKGVLGDGLVFQCSQEEYLDFMVGDGATVFRFAFELSDRQKLAIEKRLMSFNRITQAYQPQKENQSAISQLLKQTQGLAFRIIEGIYQQYFLFGTNCVVLVEDILAPAGLDQVLLAGIKTPGSLYYQLDRWQQHEASPIISSQVISRRIDRALD
ncbi:hypothetical protein ACWOBE_08260 [Hutsoniella sourekii]